MQQQKTHREDSEEYRLLVALQQLALAPRYIFGAALGSKGRPLTRLSSAQFAEFLFYLQMSPEELLEPSEDKLTASGPERTYSNYRKKLTERYGIHLDFQKRLSSGYQNYPDRQLRVLSDYLRIMRILLPPDLIERLYKRSLGKYDLLERLVLIHHYQKFQMPLRFRYQKLFGDSESETRRIALPLALTMLGNYLSMIALDTKDQIIRSFILPCITEIESDLYEDFMQKQLYAQWQTDGASGFELSGFLEEEPSAHFYRERVEYVLRLSEASLRHFEHSYNYDFRIESDAEDDTKTPPYWKTIRFVSSDPYEIRRILFDYGIYAKLIEPQEFRDAFVQSLHDLSAFYKD